MKICLYCRNEYLPIHSSQKFCSYDCAAHSRSDDILINKTHRLCRNCFLIKDLSKFHKQKSSRHGVRPKCKKCVNLESRIRYLNQCQRDVFIPAEQVCSRCCVLKTSTEFYNSKKSPTGLSPHCIECDKNWRKEYILNPKVLNRKRLCAKRFAQKKRLEPSQRLKESVSNLVWRHLKRWGENKRNTTFSKLPYSLEDLVNHLESQFNDRMSWDNYGSYWQLDHIIPQACFSYESLDSNEFLKCWSLSNLQPLEAKENASKGSFYNGKRYFYRRKEGKHGE